MFSGIYGIVDRSLTPRPLELLDAVLGAGIRVVQYRAKAGVDREVLRAMRARTRQRGAILIVNDDLAAALEADGLHAGQEDLAALDARAVRARLGRRVLGISCGVASEAVAAQMLGADYVGTGPVAATMTKGDAGAPIGTRGLREVVAATRLPVVAIGGITLGGLAEVAAAGAAMAAVVSAIAAAPDPGAAARALVERWSELTA